MKGTVWRRGAGGAALALLLVFGLGCMNVTLIRTVEDLWFTEFYHVTWIPWLVMGLAVVGCLALLGALRPLKVQSPWNYAPALVLGLILCIGFTIRAFQDGLVWPLGIDLVVIDVLLLTLIPAWYTGKPALTKLAGLCNVAIGVISAFLLFPALFL